MRTLKGFSFNQLGKNDMEIQLTKSMIVQCAHIGQCDSDVAFWVQKLQKPLSKIDPDFIKRCVKASGGWDEEELQDQEANLNRFLWIAAGNAKDDNSTYAYMCAY